MTRLTETQALFSREVIKGLTIEFKRDAMKVAAYYTVTIRKAFEDGLTGRQAVDRILWLKADRTVHFPRKVA